MSTNFSYYYGLSNLNPQFQMPLGWQPIFMQPVAMQVDAPQEQGEGVSNPVETIAPRNQESHNLRKGGQKRKRKIEKVDRVKKQKTDDNQFLTHQLIESSPTSGLSLGEDRILFLDVFAKHMLPYLSARSLHHLLFTNKVSLTIFKEQEVINKLFSSSKVNFLKLAPLTASFLGSVKEINLENSKYSNEELISLIKKFPNLNGISLKNNQTKMTIELIETIFEKSSDLVTLNLHKCKMEREFINAALFKASSTLTHLDLGGTKVSDMNLIVRELAQNSKNLTKLKLGVRHFGPYSIPQELIQQLANLKKLDLIGFRISKNVVQTLSQQSINLKSLGLIHSSLNIPNEEQVDILKELALSFPNLLKLNLDEDRITDQLKITDDFIGNFSQAHPNLTSINLSSCQLITDKAIKLLWQNCHGLTKFHLINCAKIKTVGISNSTEHITTLVDLKLSEATIMQASAVISLIQKCPNLTKIDLSKNKKMTSAVVQTLAQSCKNLKNLNLSCIQDVIGQDIQFLASNSKNLKELNLIDCQNKKITQTDIEFLLETCTNLKKLYLNRTGSIGSIGKNALIEKYPNKLPIVPKKRQS